MSEQRFDIVVQDKVAKSIRTELTAIGASAASTAAQLKALNAELGQATAAAAARAQEAATRSVASTSRLAAEQAKAVAAATRMSAEQDKAAASAERLAQAQAKTALAQQRVATEAARTAEAQAKANIAIMREEEALNRLTAADERATKSKQELTAATEAQVAASQRAINIVEPTNLAANRPAGYVPGAKSAGAGADGVVFREVGVAATAGAEQTKAAMTNVEGSVAEMENRTSSLFQRFKANAASAFDSVRDFATGGGTRFRGQANELAQGAETAGSKMQTMGTKAGMTALSVRELLVVAREGGRGDFTRMAGSLSILAMSLDVLVPALAIAAVGFTALYAARKAANTDAEQKSLKAYADSLGLTSKEMRKLQDTTLTAKGELKDFNLIQITYADTFHGLVTTIEEGYTRWRNAQSSTATDWAQVFSVAGNAVLTIFNSVAAGVMATFQYVRDEYNATKEVFSGHPIQGTIDGLKAVAAIPGHIKQDYKDIVQSQSNFASELRKNEDLAARQRLKAEADAIKNNRNPRKARTAKGWDREQNLENANSELDAQIANLGKYGDELERANQLEEIAKKFRDHNVPLTKAETDALAKKIQTLQEGRRVQQAMTAADEAANGPARTYDATIEALTTMLDKGRISQEEYTRQMNLATRAYEDAVDPLAALNRELQRNDELMGRYGKDRDVAAYIQQLQQTAEAHGQSIYQQAPKTTDPNGDIVVNGGRRLTKQAQSMVDEFKRQQTGGDLTRAMEAIDPKQKADNPTGSNYILSHHKQMYAEIDKLRQADTISEEEAARRKTNVDRAYLDARLSNASTVLGNLASLQNSKNKEVAAIGKAAAIAQATIDGIRAVQAALAGPPGPPWSFAIATTTAVATAANVAKIAGIGFMTGGYTGNKPTNEVAGAVHGREYVFDAGATARIGVPALEALRRGGVLAMPSNDNSNSRGGDVNVGQIQVNVQGVPDDPAATGRETQLGVERALRKLTQREIASQKRDGGLLAGSVMSR